MIFDFKRIYKISTIQMNVIPLEKIEFDGGVGEKIGRVGMVTLATDQTLGLY